jgi:hypothetical protein
MSHAAPSPASYDAGRAGPAGLSGIGLLRSVGAVLSALAAGNAIAAAQPAGQQWIGREVSVQRHLEDDEEFRIPLATLLGHGRKLFTANWTSQEGGGRPLTKGNGNPLADPSEQLLFPRNFNRLSGPDANSCAGCHNAPFGIPGGGGDFVANVFVLGQRFDFATLDHKDTAPTKSSVDEMGRFVTTDTLGNSRATIGMFGSGFIEMLARQMTAELQAIRDQIRPGQARALITKGVSFGVLARRMNGTWDVSRVEGLAAASIATARNALPTLIIRPFHQSGAIASLREFTVNAFNQHHGIQATERFGRDSDPDNDGVANEITRADITAVTLFQATMAVPGRVIPNDPAVEQAVLMGEEVFQSIGCAKCHIPSLRLDHDGWVFSEPNPFNPPGNLRTGEAADLRVDLLDKRLPLPRLSVANGAVMVPAYTDLKLHDICSGPDDPNAEPLDQSDSGSLALFAGNTRFLTKKLWGAANEPPFFHHGKYTTMREATLAHAGEAAASRRRFEELPPYQRDTVIEFLKTLQVLPPGTTSLVIDENGRPKTWPPHSTPKDRSRRSQP